MSLQDKSVDIKRNVLLFPIQLIMGNVLKSFFFILKLFCSSKNKSKLERLESNSNLRNVAGLAFFNALGGLIVLLTNVKIANLLGASVFGLYSYYLAIGEVGQNFVRYGRNKTMTRDLIQNPTCFDSLVANTFVLSIINLLLYLVIIICLSNTLEIDLSIASFFVIVAPCLHSIDFQPVYESVKMMSWHSIYLFLQKTFFLIGVWGVILIVNKPSILFLGFALFLSWLIIDIIQFREIISQFRINIRSHVSFTSLKKLYRDNFFIALSCIVGIAFGPLIRMILKTYSPSQDVGIYSAGMQIFLLSQFIMTQISRVGNPMMAEAGKERCTVSHRKSLCKRYVLLMLIATFPFAIPLCFFSQFVTEFFFTEEYSSLSQYLPFFGWYLIFLSIGVVFMQFLISMRKDKVYFSIYVLTALATLVVAYLIIPVYGVLGAVISLCVPHSIGCFLYFVFSTKYL